MGGSLRPHFYWPKLSDLEYSEQSVEVTWRQGHLLSEGEKGKRSVGMHHS